MPHGKSLASRLVRRGLPGVLLPAALLFIPAGSFRYWQGGAFVAVNLLGPLLLVTRFYKRDPQLLERRLLKKEKITGQKVILKVGALVYFTAFVLAGLDYRFGWSREFARPVPPWLSFAALALILGCQLFIFRVMSVNRFAARIIQLEPGQTLATTGPYRVVRHPMYSASILIWLVAAPALGSFVAWPACSLFIPLTIFRLLNEEKLLRRELPGYAEYCERTRYRLIPLVW